VKFTTLFLCLSLYLSVSVSLPLYLSLAHFLFLLGPYLCFLSLFVSLCVFLYLSFSLFCLSLFVYILLYRSVTLSQYNFNFMCLSFHLCTNLSHLFSLFLLLSIFTFRLIKCLFTQATVEYKKSLSTETAIEKERRFFVKIAWMSKAP
jgi:hypothetical protein